MSITPERETTEETPEEMISQIWEIISGFASAVSHILTQLVPAVQRLSTVLREQYQQAGAPYGDTQEGCLRWIIEMGESLVVESEKPEKDE
jgi:hypothetical protein